MNIVLLAHGLRVAGGLSVGKNITRLVPELAPQHRYLITAPAETGYDVQRKGVEVVEVEAGNLRHRLAFESGGLRKLLKSFGPDLIWGLGNLGLRHPPCRQAILLHDAHLVYPAISYQQETTLYKLKKWLLKRRLASVLPYVDTVFLQTETMRARLLNAYRYGGRTALCPNAVSVHSMGTGEGPRAPIGSSGSFKLFCLTKYYAHKNLEILVDTFREHEADLHGVTLYLTVAKDQHPLAAKLLESIEAQGLRGRIINLGPLPQEEIAQYYRVTDAMILPTMLESFSGTFLEAMYFERPILTSDLDFSREVCGDAAFYFDPRCTRSIAEAIIWCRDSRAERLARVAAGRRRVVSAHRSWREILLEVLRVLDVPFLEGC